MAWSGVMDVFASWSFRRLWSFGRYFRSSGSASGWALNRSGLFERSSNRNRGSAVSAGRRLASDVAERLQLESDSAMSGDVSVRDADIISTCS